MEKQPLNEEDIHRHCTVKIRKVRMGNNPVVGYCATPMIRLLKEKFKGDAIQKLILLSCEQFLGHCLSVLR